MPNVIKAACVQMTSGPDIDENLKTAEAFIREAAGQGASFIATPEMTDSIRRYAKDKREAASDRPIEHFSQLAKELGIWLLIGSIGYKEPSLHGLSVQSSRTEMDHMDKPCDDEDLKLANRSLLFNPNGELHAHYDKIHMFDVTLSRAEFYKESSEYDAGDRAVIVECDDFTLGMGICYDLRFPHLWRDLAKNGAQILSAPAAFTVPTGEAHWEVLLRARAIETGSFVIAPAQTGEHEAGRKTYGHSMIISPWGEILAIAQKEPCIITADLDLEDVEKARKSIPALAHDREYSLSVIPAL